MGHVRLLRAAEQVKRLGTAAVQNLKVVCGFCSFLGEESHEVIVLPWNPLDFYHSRKPSTLDKRNKLLCFQYRLMLLWWPVLGKGQTGDAFFRSQRSPCVGVCIFSRCRGFCHCVLWVVKNSCLVCMKPLLLSCIFID